MDLKIRTTKHGFVKSSHQRCSVKKVVIKIFAIFLGKHLCWSLFLKNCRSAHFNLTLKIFKPLKKIPILKNINERLLLFCCWKGNALYTSKKKIKVKLFDRVRKCRMISSFLGLLANEKLCSERRSGEVFWGRTGRGGGGVYCCDVKISRLKLLSFNKTTEL